MSKLIPNENTFVGFTLGPVGELSAPTGVTAAAGTAPGTLAAGAHAYKITAVNDTGESVASTEASETLTTEGSVALSWTAVEAASGYRIYGRVSGSETLLIQVGTVTGWLDNGQATPGVDTPPTVASGSDISSPTVNNIAECVNVTHLCTSANFSSSGNTVPTPALDTLFEGSIEGTSTATATADFYRDDEVDTAWEIFPRRTRGYVIISRFTADPQEGDVVEVWPVRVSSRAMANMTNNTAETFTVTFSVPSEPNEDAVVVAA